IGWSGGTSMGVGFLRTSVRCLTISAMMVALCALLLPSAHADGLVPLGGGSGLVVEGDTLCTLTTIGNDNRGNLIGFTSAHCGGPGARGVAEGAQGAGGVGRTGGARRARGRRGSWHDGRGQRRPRLRGDPVRPAEGAAGQQCQGI